MGCLRALHGCLARVLPLAFLIGCQEAGPQEAAPDIAMTTPFVSSADIASINEAFSSTTSAPWGFVHHGVDFFPSGNLRRFLSVAPGTVEEIRLWQNDLTANWQVNVTIRFSSQYSVEYIFEPFATSQTDGQDQLSSIAVSRGQVLSQGQPIGALHTAGAGAHLHFGLRRRGAAVCPEPYFAPAARDSILALIHKDHPDWSMCY